MFVNVDAKNSWVFGGSLLWMFLYEMEWIFSDVQCTVNFVLHCVSMAQHLNVFNKLYYNGKQAC